MNTTKTALAQPEPEDGSTVTVIVTQRVGNMTRELRVTESAGMLDSRPKFKEAVAKASDTAWREVFGRESFDR